MDATEPLSPAQIIAERGGPAVFAEKVGKTAGAVRVWKHRNYFPREAWPEISQAFSDLTQDRLRQIETTFAPPMRETA